MGHVHWLPTGNSYHPITDRKDVNFSGSYGLMDYRPIPEMVSSFKWLLSHCVKLGGEVLITKHFQARHIRSYVIFDQIFQVGISAGYAKIYLNFKQATIRKTGNKRQE